MTEKRQTKTSEQPFRHHLMLDCYECDGEILDDIGKCYAYLEKLVDILGVTRQSQPYVFRTPEGFEGKRNRVCIRGSLLLPKL